VTGPLKRLAAELYAWRMTRRTVRGMQGLQQRGIDTGGNWSALFTAGLENWAQGDRPRDMVADVAPVYIAAAIRAQGGASVPWTLFDGERDVKTHPFIDLMHAPNDELADTQLDELTRAWLLLRGRAFWFLDGEVRGIPTRIQVLEADRVAPSMPHGKLVGWKYQPANGGSEDLPLERVVRFAFADHRGRYGGLAPLEAARLYGSINWRGAKAQDLFYGRGGFPPFAVTFPAEGGVPTPDQQETMRENFRQKYLGMRNRWEPPFLFKGAEIQSIGVNQRDMEWIAEQGLSARFIFACYQVPFGYGGFTEDANRSVSAEEARRFWGGTVKADGRMISGVITARVLSRFWPGLRMEYDFRTKLAEVMPEETRAAIVAMDGLCKWGVPPEDAARIVGIDIDTAGRPWLQEGYLPFSIVLASRVLEEPEPEVDDDTDPATEDDDEDAAEKKARRRRSHWPTSDKLRTVLWKTYTARTDKVERLTLAAWRGWLEWLRDETVARLHSGKATAGSHPAIDALLVRDDEAKPILPPLDEAARQAAERTKAARLAAVKMGWESVEADLGIALEFNLLDPRVVKALSERLVFIKSAATGEMDRLRAKVAAGIQRGDSIDKIEAAIRTHINASKAGMARVVARTETLAPFARARQDAFGAAGVTKHEWLSARDQDVRESHQIDGEIRIIGEQFSNGLAFPMDPSGPAEEVIQCRCVALPVVE
jgi:SPP1 gp7 family putative phage head morphogenesis protein